jgi:Bacterial archaeo-eukaryotic release factor family 2
LRGAGAAGWDGVMPDSTTITHPLLRLGRLTLGPGLRGLAPGSTASGLMVTATVAVPDSAVSRSYALDVAWADAAREASQLGADPATAQALERGAGAVSEGDTQVVVAAHGEEVLTWRLPPGGSVSSVRVGPLPHLQEVADAAARHPAYVVVLADRDGTDIIVHAAGNGVPARRFEVGDRPGLQHDPHPDRPPAQHHGERHLTDREPESGGERNAEYTAARVVEVADSVGAHVVLGGGDQHILDAIAAHLPETIAPVAAIAGGRAADGLDDHLNAGIRAALDEITSAAIGAIGDLVASLAEGPSPAAVRGIKAVAEQLAEQQVAVLLLAADVAQDATAGSSYRIGSRPTEFLVDESDIGVEVPLEDGLVWAAVHQDAIVVQMPDRTGPLAGEPTAALLRRGSAG